jgi:hypothetical protein
LLEVGDVSDVLEVVEAMPRGSDIGARLAHLLETSANNAWFLAGASPALPVKSVPIREEALA